MRAPVPAYCTEHASALSAQTVTKSIFAKQWEREWQKLVNKLYNYSVILEESHQPLFLCTFIEFFHINKVLHKNYQVAQKVQVGNGI